MVQVILQPAGGDGERHFKDTVKNPVNLSSIEDLITDDLLKELEKLYINREVFVWGVTPGNNDINKKKWERINKGDVVLFSRRGYIFASAAVTLKTHNKNLAESLWGEDEEGNTWEYVYFIDDLGWHKIPYRRFNDIAGYKPNNVIQGFNVLNEEKSYSILNGLGLESSIYPPEVEESDYVGIFSPDNLELEREYLGKQRTEQTRLRNKLFGGKKYDNCGICGRKFTVDILATAHIKRRSECTPDERRDIDNIVMPMCYFGCDSLYEKGYVTILDGGLIVTYQDPNLPKAIIEYLKFLDGKYSDWWKSDNADYFKWHNENVFKGSM